MHTTHALLFLTPFILFGCASSTPTPEPAPQKEEVAPKVASEPVTTQHYVRQMQNSMRGDALEMPASVTADMQGIAPCMVTAKYDDYEKTNTLVYDDRGRLIEWTSVVMKEAARVKENKTSITYNAQGNTTNVRHLRAKLPPYDIAYVYANGVLSKVNYSEGMGQGVTASKTHAVTHSSNGKVVEFEDTKAVDNAAGTKSYTFDEQGRLTMVQPMSGFGPVEPSIWKYSAVDGATGTQRVDFYPVEEGNVRIVHTLKGSRLMSAVEETQATKGQQYVPKTTQTFTYDGDKLVSSSLVDAGGKVLRTLAYTYVCK